MVDLTARPFYLNDEQIAWVEKTIGSMSLEEKIGQLFINIFHQRTPEYIDSMIDQFHIGGARWKGGTKEEIYAQNRQLQEHSPIPLLIAANCEAGGNGALAEGTLVASEAACGASTTDETVRDMAKVSAEEAQTVGVNWMFAPISDILFNWRNTIVNTRSFGNDTDQIIRLSKAYIDEMRKHGIASCTKHFPGDGVEERDQHLIIGCNDLSCEKWDQSFGRVYKELIDYDIESIMIGHFRLPSYSRKLRPGIKDEDIMPATLAPEILQDLLRGKLGFNGVIVTDSTRMGGFVSAAPRSVQVPGAIAAGCDMFLFFGDAKEDFNYMLDGYRSGIITEERLSDALHRILGLKAKLSLASRPFPPKEQLEEVGSLEHHLAASRAADESITLVKDIQQAIPVDINQKKRAKLYFLEAPPSSSLKGTDKTKYIVKEELERVGFAVDLNKNYYDFEAEKPDPKNSIKVLQSPPVEEFKKNYDIVFVFVHMNGYAQENNVRIKWAASHSNELPWYIQEVPTICVSLNYTNHLFDLPMMKTFINSYAPTREYIRATIEKIIGQSPFKGTYNETVFCSTWDTRL